MTRHKTAKPPQTSSSTELHQQALRLYAEGRMAEALEQLRAALHLNETGELWNDWAAVQYALGAVQQAEIGFRKAYDFDKTYLQAAANLGTMLVSQGRTIEAAPFLLAALNTTDDALRSAVASVISRLPSIVGLENSAGASPK